MRPNSSKLHRRLLWGLFRQLACAKFIFMLTLQTWHIHLSPGQIYLLYRTRARTKWLAAVHFHHKPLLWFFSLHRTFEIGFIFFCLQDFIQKLIILGLIVRNLHHLGIRLRRVYHLCGLYIVKHIHSPASGQVQIQKFQS